MTGPRRGDLEGLQAQALAELAACERVEQLEAWRVAYLGRKGQVPRLLRTVKERRSGERQAFGQAANELRQQFEEAYKERQAWLVSSTPVVKGSQTPGVTAAQAPLTRLSGLPERGHLHPLTITIRRLQDIFGELGFRVIEGPLVELPHYNFDFLNIPPEHPARGMMDTFYLTNGQVLRAHVSTLQIRAVRDYQVRPPYKIMYYGPCYRAERTDATHESTFHQFEFMVVDRASSLAELKGMIETVYSRFFGKRVQIRLRPAYFPFVEPGLEIDIACVFCAGKGCRICKHSGWIEMAGAGMVHPQVLRTIEIDPAAWQGYAFGAAVDRLAMLQYGIEDIRQFWSGDLRFLQQF